MWVDVGCQVVHGRVPNNTPHCTHREEHHLTSRHPALVLVNQIPHISLMSVWNNRKWVREGGRSQAWDWTDHDVGVLMQVWHDGRTVQSVSIKRERGHWNPRGGHSWKEAQRFEIPGWCVVAGWKQYGSGLDPYWPLLPVTGIATYSPPPLTQHPTGPVLPCHSDKVSWTRMV